MIKHLGNASARLRDAPRISNKSRVYEVLRLSTSDGSLVERVTDGCNNDVSCNPNLYTLPYLMSIGDRSLKQIDSSLLSPPEWAMPDFTNVDDIEVNSIG